jgi:general stress protein 26
MVLILQSEYETILQDENVKIMSMTEEEMRELALDIMSEAECVYVSTITQDGFPEIRAMNNMRNLEQYERLKHVFETHDNDFMILLSTNTSSEKVAQLKKNTKISLYFKKPDVWQGVTFIGEAEFMGDDVKKAIWADNMKIYYPKGFDDPDHTVLRIFPKIAKGWNTKKLTTFQFTIG